MKIRNVLKSKNMLYRIDPKKRKVNYWIIHFHLKTSQMTQGTRRPNQMEFKARPNIAGECLDIFQYKI